MRYAAIEKFEAVNGIGCGVSLYVQGCPFRCPGCFNQITWDFNGGHEWTQEIEEEFFCYIDKPYISRVSFLGGEPLANENVEKIFDLVKKIHNKFPNKQIWLFTGHTIKIGKQAFVDPDDDFKLKEQNYLYCEPVWKYPRKNIHRSGTLGLVDVVVDGRFEEDKKSLTLAFRGSSNQRIIDVQNSLIKGEIILWNHSK